MYGYLSEAITPKQKQCKIAMAPSTVSFITASATQTATFADRNHDKQNPTFDPGNMDLEEFNTIDEKTLANLIYDTDLQQNDSNDKENQDALAIPKTPNKQQINLTTFNNTQMPTLPHMYCPKPNVNMHYHSQK